MEASKMDKKKHDAEEMEKYGSFLHIIAFVSIGTILFELVICFFNIPAFGSARFVLVIISLIILLLIIFMGFAIASGTKIYDPIDNLITKIDKGKAVTVIFFAFLGSNLVFIMQDGGAQESCITNILLISSSFGFFFAKKKQVKAAVTVLYLFSYISCLIFYYDEEKEIFCFHPITDILPSILVVIFVLLINFIITAKIRNVSEE